MNRKRARASAWFGVVLIFVSGMVAGLLTFRIFAGQYVGRVLLDPNRDILEDWMISGLIRGTSIPPEHEGELRVIYRDAQAQIQSSGLRIHGYHADALERAIIKIREFIPLERRPKFEYGFYRLLIAVQHPLIASFAVRMKLTAEEQFELNRLITKEFEEIQSRGAIPLDELVKIPRRVLTASMDEFRPTLSEERQAELAALGPGLEKLEILPRTMLLDPDAVPVGEAP